MKNILYIEDNAVTATIVRKKMEQSGFTVEVVDSGEKGLKEIERRAFNVILIDYELPGIQGMEVVRILTEQKISSPIIMVTGHGNEKIAVEAMKLGAFDYIAKGERGEFINILPMIIEKAYEQSRLIQETEDAHRELRKHENRYSNLVRTIPDIIYMLDAQGGFVFLNEAISNLNYNQEELLGKHFSIFVHPDDIARVSRDEIRSKKKPEETTETPKLFDENRTGERKTMGLELRILHKKERESEVLRAGNDFLIMEVNSMGQYEEDEHGNNVFVGTIGIFRDITERVIAEQHIRKMNTELEERVQERTKELSALNQELEAFSYSVSHDLQSPLRQIIQHAELMKSEVTPNTPLADSLESMANSASGMSSLIQGLLKFSRVGRAEIRKRKINMNNLVQEVLYMTKEQNPGRTIEWKTGDLPEVQGDLVLLRQVLLNLVGNAVKFTGKTAGAKIEIGCENRESMHDFFVRDNGVGFNAKYAGKVFDVFQRFHSQDDFEGSGIGLASVKRIIERQGGTVRAESKPDEETCFYFTLPVE